MTEIMTLTVIGLEDFAREIEYKGETLKVTACGMGDEFKKSQRLVYLMQKIIWSDNFDMNILNEVGFSNNDSNIIDMEIEDLNT